MFQQMHFLKWFMSIIKNDQKEQISKRHIYIVQNQGNRYDRNKFRRIIVRKQDVLD